MSTEMPAEDLLARVARHDVDALSELYDRYAPRVYGLVAHILPAREGAEEILEEVFVRLWGESARLAQEGNSVVAWLVVTGREAALDRLRGLRKERAGNGPTAFSPDGGKTSDPAPRKSKAGVFLASSEKPLDRKITAGKAHSADSSAAALMGPVLSAWLPMPKEINLIDERLVLLNKVIDQLPSPQRQALELAVFGGLSESQIAAKIGEPLGKVQRSLRAAVTFVKQRRRAVCGTWAANI